MKNKRGIIILAAIIILAIGIGIGAYAASNFGTQSDPLVAKSYIDNVLTPSLQAQYQSQLDNEVQKLEQKISNASGTEAGNFSAVTLTVGQTLAGNAGCEIILVSGSTSAYGGGLSDVTSGSALSSGSSIAANHLCVAGADGSGVTALGESALLVRGTYAIQ